MIKIENVRTEGWDPALCGMRNPHNSWNKFDSGYVFDGLDKNGGIQLHYEIGPNDWQLATQLVKAGTDHGKFMRMIAVWMNITAPRYWWIEWDTAKVGTVSNSCSTMHTIMSKPFETSDFSCDAVDEAIDTLDCDYYDVWHEVDKLNFFRDKYLSSENADTKKMWWRATIQSLPQSYNQMRTVNLNYQVLRNMYHSRKNHKLLEWRQFCEYIEKDLPYSELITMEATR